MSRRFIVAAGVAFAAVAVTAACADSAASNFKDGSNQDAGTRDGSDHLGDEDAAVGAASGVVILHAAAFPAFRLCFENYPNLAPQPDTSVMPEANVVGVEVGSVSRLGSLATPPGTVYVIDQREVRTTPRDPADRKCGALIADKNFVLDLKYQIAGRIDQPLGVGHVDVLAITGCGGEPWLRTLETSREDCGDYDPVRGSLEAVTVSLFPSVAASKTALPVQLVHMSSLLEARRAPGEVLDVTFGPLDTSADGPLEQTVASAPTLYDGSAPTTLALDQSSEAVYGSHGFRIALRAAKDAGADAGAAFFVDQSLADVQELSFSHTVPTSYYVAASNYALLLLGDPRVTQRYPDGGANPDFNPRRAVHLLAVPVKDDSDAGTLSGIADASIESGATTPDGGNGG